MRKNTKTEITIAWNAITVAPFLTDDDRAQIAALRNKIFDVGTRAYLRGLEKRQICAECGKRIRKTSVMGTIAYDGITYLSCSELCHEKIQRRLELE